MAEGDHHDLRLLRTLGAELAEMPADLEAHVEDQVLQAIVAEELAGRDQAKAPRRAATRAQRRWFGGLVRPAAAIGAAASLALGVAVISDGGPGAGSPAGSVTQASSSSVFDSTASTIFGDVDAPDASGSGSSPGVVGSINLADDASESTLVDGPTRDRLGHLSGESAQLAASISRDPGAIRNLVRESVDELGIEDDGDRTSYRVTMRWVVDVAVPPDLRAAMLRSVGGLDGMDEIHLGADLLGRTGLVIGHHDDEVGIRTQALLDRGSGSLLELRSYTTAYVDPACPPGTVTEHAVFEGDRRIDPASMPWVDWPMIIAACDDSEA